MPSPTETVSTLGSSYDAGSDACRFRLRAPRAERVELYLADADRHVDLQRDDSGTWTCTLEEVRPGARYGYRVHGDNADPRDRFDPSRLLLDPYAHQVSVGAGDHVADLAVVTSALEPPRPLDRPVDRAKAVLYELHVKGYTARHPAVPSELRGTYAALARPEVLDHICGLGVTSVELLPVQQFRSEPELVARGLVNYWGYNPLAWFAPHAAYASVPGREREEFRDLVDALHARGLEVILDVVYNHTCEGRSSRPPLSLRGIDARGTYRLTADGHDIDVTGCGNSVDSAETDTTDLIATSLRYWVQAYGIDGFRFDLAPTLLRDADGGFTTDHPLLRAIDADPALSGTTMIAEPWDLGPDGYRLGGFPSGWGEWNDRFRTSTRDFWRGAGSRDDLYERVTGSPDVFGARPSVDSVNYVTVHDGFTLRDLVSFAGKHNDANGEHNADGTDDNRSDNCGVEGDTDDDAVLSRRRRRATAMLTTLLLSRGTPLLLAGDELGRSQGGNNNAYCQDDETSWVDWQSAWPWAGDVVRELIRLRAAHPALYDAEHSVASGHVVDGTDRVFGVTFTHADGDVVQLWINGSDAPVEVDAITGRLTLAPETLTPVAHA